MAMIDVRTVSREFHDEKYAFVRLFPVKQRDYVRVAEAGEDGALVDGPSQLPDDAG